MTDHNKPKKCPDCGHDAPRHLPAGVSGVFALTTDGMGPQNTGVSEIDANIDRVIGADAHKGWKAIDDRNAIKEKELRSNPGASSYDLSLNPDGSYRVMKPEEKQIHARAFTINALAMDAQEKARKKQNTAP